MQSALELALVKDFPNRLLNLIKGSNMFESNEINIHTHDD